MIGLVLVIAVVVVIDLAAVLWGTDSRSFVDDVPSHRA
jgi:nitrogen fixation-related uncharacterized protein